MYILLYLLNAEENRVGGLFVVELPSWRDTG